MEILFYVLNAWIIGFAIGAVVGPIGILCIKNTLEFGFYAGMAVGLGAALADGLYGLVAATGMTVITNLLLTHVIWIKIMGGLFLVYMAIKEFYSVAPVLKTVSIQHKNIITLSTQIFFLTLANPVTILSFMSVFAALGNAELTITKSLWMTLGIFLGSMTWWVVLTTTMLYVKRFLSESFMNYIRYISAAILFIFGVGAIMSTLFVG